MMSHLDEHGFEALVEGYAPDLYRTARWLGADRPGAEDLVQETLLRAWRARGSVRDPGAIKAWLVTILRRESARRFERWRPQPAEIDPDDLGADDSGPSAADRIAVRRAIAALDPMYREPLVLQLVWGLSCDEIAGVLELTPGAVMTRLFRARAQARDLLDETAPARKEGSR